MVSFKEMKKNRKNELDSLKEEAEKMNKKSGFEEDDRFWKLTVDKAGNGTAVIRFLPAPKDEDVPFIRYYDHGFQGPGGWFIEKSLTTLGQKDPVSEHNSELWNTGLQSNKDIVSGTSSNPGRKRRLHYVSNIYVVSDPAHPENEGKVFLFDYGMKIFEKVNDCMFPEYDAENRSKDDPDYDPTNAFNPFDFWEGANFRLRARKYQGYRNYDKSEWEDCGPLSDDDEELEKIWLSQHSLQAEISPDKFKTYDELKARLDKVLGLSGSSSEATKTAEGNKETPPWEAPKETVDNSSKVNDNDEDKDDALAKFRNLANED